MPAQGNERGKVLEIENGTACANRLIVTIQVHSARQRMSYSYSYFNIKERSIHSISREHTSLNPLIQGPGGCHLQLSAASKRKI